MNDYEVVVRGLAAMVAGEPSVVVVELDSWCDPVSAVDIALFDSFGADQGPSVEVRRVLELEHVGRVVAYSWNLDPELVASTLAAGASGYLSKSLTAAQLVDALLRVQAGEVVVSPERVGGDTSGDWPGREHGLSAREAEVLGLIVQGLTNEQIARRSFLSINTVKTYIRAAYRKIGVERRTQAILWGMDHGFVPRRTRTLLDPDAEVG